MKNLVKSALVALTVSMFAIPASAESYALTPVNVRDTVVEKDTVVKKEVPQTLLLTQEEVTYTKLEVASLPEVITKAVAAKYEGYTIAEAAKGTDNSYKLVIQKKETKLAVYFNASGEFLKEETPKTEGTLLV